MPNAAAKGLAALPNLPYHSNSNSELELETHPFTTFTISSKIDSASFFEMR
jgi:hypothetical protein